MANETTHNVLGDPLNGYARLLMQLGGWAVVALFMYWLLPVFLEQLIESQKSIKVELHEVIKNGNEQVELLRDIKESVQKSDGKLHTAQK